MLRSEVTPNRELNPTAYDVFGPKIVATRGFFDDRALESRCLTEEMGQRKLRPDIPINLPSAHKQEALHLRNKLLLFRFRNFHKKDAAVELVDRTIEPRLNQIFVPLLSIIEDASTRRDLQKLACAINREHLTDRGMDTEGQVLEIIRTLRDAGRELSVKQIALSFAEKYGSDYERPITPKWIGNVIRRKLRLKTRKSNGVFLIEESAKPILERLYEKYGILPNQSDEG